MTLAKVDVGAVGEGLGTDIPVHVYSVATGVDTHLTEIHTKPWLHVGTHSVWQGTATSFALTDLSFNIGSCLEAFSQCTRGFGLDQFGFVLFCVGLSLQGFSARLGEKLRLEGLLLVFRPLTTHHLPLYERGD